MVDDELVLQQRVPLVYVVRRDWGTSPSRDRSTGAHGPMPTPLWRHAGVEPIGEGR